MNYRKFYWLDKYLFDEVGPRFRATGRLTSLDLYSILHWKAARAKARHKKRLKLWGGLGNERAQAMANQLLQAKSNQEKLELLFGEPWNFRLPTASAILTVLWPGDFTVYDWRVANELGEFKWLADVNPPNVWSKYLMFMEAVKTRPPPQPSLRDYDQFFGDALSTAHSSRNLVSLWNCRRLKKSEHNEVPSSVVSSRACGASAGMTA